MADLPPSSQRLIELKDFTKDPQRGSSPPNAGSSGSLHQAARAGRVDELQEWLGLDRSGVNSMDSDGYTPFHYAAECHHLDVLRTLVEFGADPKLCTEYGQTALHLAAAAMRSNHNPSEQESHAIKETWTFLVEDLRLDVNATWPWDNSCPLHIACSSGNKTAVEVLVNQEEIQLELVDYKKCSILHKICATNNVELLELLLGKLKETGQLSEMLVARNKISKRTPLGVAFSCGHLEMASKLLAFASNDEYSNIDSRLLLDCSHGNESNGLIEFLKVVNLRFLSRRSDGATILHQVADRGWARAAREIAVREPSLLNEKDNDDSTPLHYAAAKNNCKIVDLLMNQDGTDVDAADKDGCTPLLVAAREGCTEAFAKLLEKADLKKVDSKGKNVVILAAETDHSTILEAAIEKAPTIAEQVDWSDNTPLHAAADNGSERSLKILLDQRVNVNARNKTRRAPLHQAARNGHNGCVKILLAYCPSSENDADQDSPAVDVSALDEDACTPLHLAAFKGYQEVAATLFSKGVDVDARNNAQWTPLHYAAGGGHQEMVELLISKYHAKVDAKNHSDKTPLHVAAASGHASVVTTLMQHNADLKAVVRLHVNALELAIKNGHTDVVMAIVKHDKWKDAMRNTSDSLSRYKKTTPMRRLIKKMPEAAREVLNRCTVTNHNPDEYKYDVFYDYEFLEDMRDPEYFDRSEGSLEADRRSSVEPQLRRHWYQPSFLFNRLVQRCSRSSNEGYYTTWGPPWFDEANHPLSIMVRHKRTELLDHPLVSTLIAYKWKRAWPLYLANILFYVLFLSFLTAYALVLPNPQSELCFAVSNTNASVECGNVSNATARLCGKCSSNQPFLYAAGAIILFCVTVRVVLEFFQFLENLERYFLSRENWLEIFLYSLTLIFMSSLGGTCVCPKPWQWQIGALAVFLAWIHLSIFIRKLPQLGLYIIMFEDIVLTFVKIAIPALLLVLAFSMAFYMMFFVPSPLFAASPFATPGLSIIKAMTMAVGEIEFDSIFRLTPGGVSDIDDVPTPIPYTGVSILLWIFFLILMPILLMNLLTGLAVGDVEKIQCDAEYRKLELQIQLVVNVERLFQAFHTWFVPIFEDWRDSRKMKRVIYVRPNKHTGRQQLRSLLSGVDNSLTGEKIAKSLAEPIKNIKLEHVHKHTTTLLAELKQQRTELAELKTEQRSEVAALQSELRLLHEKNHRLEKGMKAVLELLAKREGVEVDTSYLASADAAPL